MDSRISDNELIRLLNEHGIAFEQKTFVKKRDILIKQVNHAIARSKPPSPKKSGASSSQSSANISTRSTRSRGAPDNDYGMPVLQQSSTQVFAPPEPPMSSTFYQRMPSSIAPNSPPSTIRSPASSLGSPQQLMTPMSQHGGEFNTPGSSHSFYGGVQPRHTPMVYRVAHSPVNTPIQRELPLKQHFQQFASTYLNPRNYLTAFGVVVVAVLLVNSLTKPPAKQISPKYQLANEQIVASSVDKLLICDSKREKPCFPEAVVRNCLPILPHIRAVLDEDNLKLHCTGNLTAEYKGLPLSVTLTLAKQLSKNLPDPDETALLTLIHYNPHWRIVLIDQSGDIAESVDAAVTLRTKNVKITWTCSAKIVLFTISYFAMKLFFAVCGFVIVTALALALIWTVKGKIAYRRAFKSKVHEFADLIVEAVKRQHEAYADQLNMTQHTPPAHLVSQRQIKDFVVISHMFDDLVPLEQRAEFAPMWKAAVELIRSSESRIRTDVRTVDGEHVKVWVWTAGQKTPQSPFTASSASVVSPKSSVSTMQNGSNSKQSTRTPSPRRSRVPLQPQNSASTRPDRSPSAGRRPVATPGNSMSGNSPQGLTPCLKIRGILTNRDPNNARTTDEARSRIREAALALGSCGARNVLEIHVKSLQDGLLAVYVRCMDETASGRLTSAIRKLYPNLATVHYVTLEKFAQQFGR